MEHTVTRVDEQGSTLRCGVMCWPHLERGALHGGGGGAQGGGRGHGGDDAGVMLQCGQQQRLCLNELGLQQHLGSGSRTFIHHVVLEQMLVFYLSYFNLRLRLYFLQPWL